MKFLILFFIFIMSFAQNYDKQIKNTKQNLNILHTKISNMNQKLDAIAKQIKQKQIYLNNINKQISALNKKIANLEYSLNKNQKLLNKLKNQLSILKNKKNNLENNVIDYISNNYYINNSKAFDTQDVINEEILKIVTKQSAKKMENITKVYTELAQKIKEINKVIQNINKTKKILQNRKYELAKLKKIQTTKLLQLSKIKNQYKQKLQTIISNQNKLQNKLANLNIIKKQELQKQREIAKQNLKNNQNLKKIDKIKVKNYGNIYMSSRKIRYRGRKTIPPVQGKIIKNFGAYKDPIYNIALYNDSITIKTRPNSKVRAIFDGVVVFVGDTNEGKMIVIKHRHKLHSIYAGLSRISPYIKKGYRVKKGEIIAKVNGELEFEVTYKTLPINPLEIINFK